MSDLHPEHTERDLLLPRSEDGEHPAASVHHGDAPVKEEEDDRTTAQRLAIAVPALILLLLLEFGSVMSDVPLNEITEAIICRSMHGASIQPATDVRCKGTDVQSELALITGWEMTFSFIPSLITAIPYGLAADRYGRRAVLLLANLGVILSSVVVLIICRYPDTFPIRLRWLAPVFFFIGGGPSTFNAMIYTITSDITTQNQRSTAFFYVATAMTTGVLVASPLTSLIMSLGGAWITLYIGFALILFTVPLTAALPETRCEAVVKRAEMARKASSSGTGRSKWDILPLLRSVRDQSVTIVNVFFLQKPTVGILLFSTVFTVLGRNVVLIMLQYVTKVFGWPWSKAPLVTTIQGVAGLVLTALLLPAISQMLLKTGMPAFIKDWWIVRVSAVISILGTLGMGLAPTASLFIAAIIFGQMGGGMMLALRSMLTELVDQTNVALLMTMLGVFITVSEMIAGPLLAQMFHVGMKWGGIWIGMPFFTSAAMLAVGTAMVIFVPVGRLGKQRTSAMSEEEEY